MNIVPFDNEPRVLDTDLGDSLGFARGRVIKELIERNVLELQAFGNLPRRTANSGQRGRPSHIYYLNRQQALVVCMLSKTPSAQKVRAELIRRFDAYDNPTPSLPTTYIEALKALVAAEEEKAGLLTENKELKAELDFVTVDEFRSLRHAGWPLKFRQQVGIRAAKLARREGVTLDKQERQYKDPKTSDITVSYLNVYPRRILECAVEQLS